MRYQATEPSCERSPSLPVILRAFGTYGTRCGLPPKPPRCQSWPVPMASGSSRTNHPPSSATRAGSPVRTTGSPPWPPHCLADARLAQVQPAAGEGDRDERREADQDDREAGGQATGALEVHGRMATTRAGAALAPTIGSGKQATWKPVDGSAPRLARRSIWQYGRSAWWAAQKTPRSSRAFACLGLEVQRRVPAPGVDAHHAHAAVEQPARGLRRDAAPARDVVGRAEERVAARADEDDVARPRASWPAAAIACSISVGRDRVAVLLRREVDHDAGRVEASRAGAGRSSAPAPRRSSSCSGRARRRGSSCGCRSAGTPRSPSPRRRAAARAGRRTAPRSPARRPRGRRRRSRSAAAPASRAGWGRWAPRDPRAALAREG